MHGRRAAGGLFVLVDVCPPTSGGSSRWILQFGKLLRAAFGNLRIWIASKLAHPRSSMLSHVAGRAPYPHPGWGAFPPPSAVDDTECTARLCAARVPTLHQLCNGAKNAARTAYRGSYAPRRRVPAALCRLSARKRAALQLLSIQAAAPLPAVLRALRHAHPVARQTVRGVFGTAARVQARAIGRCVRRRSAYDRVRLEGARPPTARARGRDAGRRHTRRGARPPDVRTPRPRARPQARRPRRRGARPGARRLLGRSAAHAPEAPPRRAAARPEARGAPRQR
jgi:hypothetical protein